MNPDYIALEWVKGEIQETLNQAQIALEEFAEKPADESALTICRGALHQVHGTLQMVEFYGAALLAEEMEAAAMALAEKRIANAQDGMEVLMQAIIQLPYYLEHVKVGRRDLPVVLLPILNELRSVRGENLLSETALFSPYIEHNPPLSQNLRAQMSSPEFGLWLRKTRQTLQVATLQLLKGQETDTAGHYLNRLFAKLNKTLGGTPQGLVWLPALAFSEWLMKQAAVPKSAKLLLRQLDQLLKQSLEHGADVIGRPPAEELLKNLLFYVARTESRGDAIRAVQKKYKLDEALPTHDQTDQDGNLTSSGHDAIRAAVSQLSEEIHDLKDVLDALVRSTHGPVHEQLNTIAIQLQKFADTLGVLGLGMPRSVIVEQEQQLQGLMAEETISDDALLDIAGALLYVEASLESMLRDGDFSGRNEQSAMSDAQHAVILESRNLLQEIREAMEAWAADTRAYDLMAPVPDMLNSIHGSLRMLNMEVLADASGDIEASTGRLLDLGSDIAQQDLEALADALAALDYVLEQHDAHGSNIEPRFTDRLLEAVEVLKQRENEETDSSERLTSETEASETGDPDAGSDGGEDVLAAPETVTDDIVHDEPAEDSQKFISEHPEVTTQDTDSETTQAIAPVDDEPASPDAVLSFDDIELNDSDQDASLSFDQILDDAGIDSEDDVDEIVLGLPDDLEEASAPQDDPAAADSRAMESQVADESVPSDAADEDFIDEEIIEVFLEEADEVISALNEFWPEYKASPTDSNALVEVRRAFHTLKGSGRMVQATSISELAWAIENLLNRLLDKTVEYSDTLVALVDQVMALLPVLVDDFRNQQPASQDTAPYIACAEALANGDAQAELPAAPVTAASESPSEISDDNHERMGLLEIFIGEASVHLDAVAAFCRYSRQEFCTNPLTDELQRALHTLKGSAYMADIEPVAALAALMERTIKEGRACHLQNSAELVDLLEEGLALLQPVLDTARLAVLSELDGSDALSERLRAFMDRYIVYPESQPGSDQTQQDALSAFMAVTMDAVMEAEEQSADWQHSGSMQRLTALENRMNDVAATATAAGYAGVSALASALADFYAEQAPGIPVAGKAGLVAEAQDTLLNLYDCLAAGQTAEAPQELILRLQQSGEVYGGVRRSGDNNGDNPDDSGSAAAQTEAEDAELDNSEGLSTVSDEPETDSAVGTFLEEADEILSAVPAHLDHWQSSPHDLLPLASLQQEMHTLQGAAGITDFGLISSLSGELETLCRFLHDGLLDADDSTLPLLRQAYDDLQAQVEAVRSGLMPVESLLTERIRTVIASAEIPQDSLEEPETGASEYDQIASESLDSSDREIIEIFLEESEELMEVLDNSVEDWKADPNSRSGADEILRTLHTIKGGARLAGLSAIGDYTHTFEEDVQKALNKGKKFDDAFFTHLNKRQEILQQRIEKVAELLGNEGVLVMESDPVLIEPAPELDIPVLNTPAESETAPVSTDEEPALPVNDEVTAPLVPVEKDDGHQQLTTERRAPTELVKVSADLLDTLVNLAGETAIGRGRLEQQVSDFSGTLGEMDQTLERLSDQLRRLDRETEAQVLFRQERQGPDYSDFDPLEMDRYSTIQQLSRALMESASDLMDLKATLHDKARDTESVLQQQARISTELQSGLMKTRMVPFQRMVPRLRRIVRQVSLELDKQVELQVSNADGEMDRSILDRLVTPLEHMLRNAVDHGIESPKKREKAGKPATGRINLDMRRDGGDVVLTMTDDGRGINLEAVLNKARQRGLVAEGAEPDEDEILQYILQPGFSTAEVVTQISGRGVGMDVISSEIKQMGGTLEIATDEGAGTRFVLRVPFTVSVNRALMVRIGEDLYAIPLNTIQGIVRVPLVELENLYALPEEERQYDYSGQSYQLDYLGSLMKVGAQPAVVNQRLPVPLILVQGQKPTALQVDTLLGAKEIVVKSLGPQFAGVPGVSGGTIMGDGSVVIILDLQAMVRDRARIEADHKRRLAAATASDTDQQQPPKVLVVDDSVTVRKVTGRLLERHGIEVETAKDGVEALETMQSEPPDVVLLDIEMPRMDGFEVASHMRHDSRLKDIPIIMITSRTGDKHREHALSLGVNEYMGKPFQEEALISHLETFTGRKLS